MNCPKCGGDMQSGLARLDTEPAVAGFLASVPGALSMKLSRLTFDPGGAEILGHGQTRSAHRCLKCNSITVMYGDAAK